MAIMRQNFFGPADKPWRINKITGARGPEIDRYDHHLVVYIDGEDPKPVIHMCGGAEKRELFESYPKFMDLIEPFWPLSYDDILLITTLFPLDPRYATPERVSRLHRHHCHPFFEEFLSASRGLLLYSHQLEQVCSLVQGMNTRNARNFKKEWNLKDRGIQALAAIIPVDEERSLYDFIQEATLDESGCVYDADFKGAWRLYNHLNPAR